MIRRSIALLAVLLGGACDSDRTAEVENTVTTSNSSEVTGAPGEMPAISEAIQSSDTMSLPAAPGDSPALRLPTSDAPSASPNPSSGGAEAPVAGEAANDILERAERAYDQVRSMEADFSQEIYIPLLDATRSSRGKMYHQAPDRFAMRFSDPQGDLIVADGSYVWMYHPSTDDRQVIRSRLAAGGQQVDLQKEFLSDASTRYAATRTGTENVGGRSAHALTLVPRGPSPYRRIRIWVDAEDSLVRRFEITEENQSVRRLELSNLRPNASIPASIFQFTPPANVQIFEP